MPQASFNMSDGKGHVISSPFLIGTDVHTLTLINDYKEPTIRSRLFGRER
jgi:hypothetical protein